MTFSTAIACCSFMSKHFAIFSHWTKFVIVFDKGEQLQIRSFASPMCLRCHSISDFGCHLGVHDKCLNIMLSVGGMVTSPCSAEDRSIEAAFHSWLNFSLAYGIVTLIFAWAIWADLMRWMLIIWSCWAMKLCYYDYSQCLISFVKRSNALHWSVITSSYSL